MFFNSIYIPVLYFHVNCLLEESLIEIQKIVDLPVNAYHNKEVKNNDNYELIL